MWHVLEILSERLQARRSATAISQANPLITMQMAASAVFTDVRRQHAIFHTARQP